MRTPPIAILLGAAIILGTISLNVYQRRLQDADVRGITALRSVLDGRRLALATASTGSDSARLIAEIRAREEAIAVRAYHVPQRQAELDRWWQPTGPGSILMTFGSLLLLVGLASLRRRKPGAA